VLANEMTPEKVQLFYASIGSGHFVAARSISEAIKNINPEIRIELQDIFEHSKVNVFLQEIMAFLPSFIFPELYTRIWKRGSLKWLYQLSCSIGFIKGDILKKVQAFSPDLIICTHTYPCSVISKWKQNQSSPPLIAVATDQFIHPYWPIRNVDAFITPNIPMKKELILRGYEKDKIYPFGIPVSPKLKISGSEDKKQKRIKVIVLAGSYRMAPYIIIHKRVKEMLEYLVSHQSNQILWQFVFGASKDLATFAHQKFLKRTDVQICDYPENVQMMMADSDFVFTKPGGLTVAEALALKKPIVLLTKGAGQERGNSNYVINSGSGILLDKKVDLIQLMEDLLHNPSSVKKRFIQPSNPLINSAQKVAQLALRLMDGN
jgi:processive 1,2-diacylglycerol beta-glucosyltransferase